MDGSCVLVPAIILVVGITMVSLTWRSNRSQELIAGWAHANQLTIVDQEARSFRRGPLFWSTAEGQTVYRITVRDQRGQQRTGWLRCGGRWLGLHSDAVEVRWDE